MRTMDGTARQALANQEETPYSHAAAGLGCCLLSYRPKEPLARPAAGLTNLTGTTMLEMKWEKHNCAKSLLLPLHPGELCF